MAALDALVDSLRRLPGVGPRTAARMAYHLLQNDREGAALLASSLTEAARKVRHCSQCHTFTEDEVCHTCRDPGRDRGLLCVVETPADQAAVEQTMAYRGLYFVLLGRLKPLDGVGPRDIALDALVRRVTPADDAQAAVREVIVATSFTAEGEATAYAIAEALRPRGVKVTRLARGVPVGSELEFVDLGTIAHALMDRR